MNDWEKSHAGWWREDELRLQKLNFHRGIGAEDDAPGVPYELRHMLPTNPTAADSPAFSEGLPALLPTDVILDHPMTKHFATLELQKLTGQTSTSEIDPTDWLAKLLGDTEQILSGRVSLPTHQEHHTGGDPLVKGEIQSSLTSLLSKIRRNAAVAGAAIDFTEMEKMIRCLDIDGFGQLALAALEKIDRAMHAIAA